MFNLKKRFLEGWNWKPWTPYTGHWSDRLQRGIHNALGLHYRGNDGSWCFGVDYICAGCGMDVGRWSKKKCETMAAAIDRLPADQQQEAAARMCR